MGRTADSVPCLPFFSSGAQSEFSLKGNHMWGFTHGQAGPRERKQVTVFLGGELKYYEMEAGERKHNSCAPGTFSIV